MSKDCPFCGYFTDSLSDTTRAIEPLNPVTKGHMLFVPREHVIDATDNPRITARVMQAACMYAKDLPACNIITSKGKDATQSVFHLHIHVVPRNRDDGLTLPWTGQIKSSTNSPESDIS